MLSSKTSFRQLHGTRIVPMLLCAVLAYATTVVAAHAQDAAQPPYPVVEPPYRVVEVENGGKITGVVRFEDEYPPSESFKVKSDNQICGLTKHVEDFVVDPATKGLANVVVTIQDIGEGKGFELLEAPTLTQESCVYSPHVQVFKSKDKLTVLNNDELLHNVHILEGEKTILNVAQSPGAAYKKKLVRRITASEVVTVKCDVHEWMSAYLVPVTHPYVAVTGAKGEFEIDQVPPGSYTLLAWHEVMGTMERQVTVAGGATAEVAFDIVANE